MTEKSNYNFAPEKNQQLIEGRGISFEKIISAIENNRLLDIVEHPNANRYSNQQMYVVEFNDYVYLVPFVVEAKGKIFLKAIFPSRKATKKYLKKVESDE